MQITDQTALTQPSTKWSEGPLLGFDTETTGVDITADRIVTTALVHRGPGGSTTVRTWLINPGIEIPAGATAVHGITTEHAREHGMSPRDALHEISTEIATAVQEGTPIVAFNATFDVCILGAELVRHGLPTLPQLLGSELIGVIDPLVLDRHEDRFRSGKRKLIDLCGVYGVQVPENLHSADVDVLATLDVLRAIATRFPHLGEFTLDQLHEYQHHAHHKWATSFNEWRTRRGLTGPGAGLTWLRHT